MEIRNQKLLQLGGRCWFMCWYMFSQPTTELNPTLTKHVQQSHAYTVLAPWTSSKLKFVMLRSIKAKVYCLGQMETGTKEGRKERKDCFVISECLRYSGRLKIRKIRWDENGRDTPVLINKPTWSTTANKMVCWLFLHGLSPDKGPLSFHRGTKSRDGWMVGWEESKKMNKNEWREEEE